MRRYVECEELSEYFIDIAPVQSSERSTTSRDADLKGRYCFHDGELEDVHHHGLGVEQRQEA
jgi:hypothetical protein